MGERVDWYDGTYGHFAERVQAAIRQETFGVDIGQNSWITVEEYGRWLPFLDLGPGRHLLEVASGSGGPAVHVARTTGCRVTGIDVHSAGLAEAGRLAEAAGVGERVRFEAADATARLPFADGAFDALLCMDSINHFPDRRAVLCEWRRVLRPGGRVLFTDPVVITGPVTNDELAVRSSIGLFLFVPPGVTGRLVGEAGLRLLREEDASEGAAQVAGRWRRAREARGEELVRSEGEARFAEFQRFLAAVHELTSQRRLSRFVYLAERPEGD
jgi:SAM-dependent methyltransferase